MKKPLDPPDISQLAMASLDRLPDILQEGRILVAGKYLHWDNPATGNRRRASRTRNGG